MSSSVKTYVRDHLPASLVPLAKSTYYAVFRSTIRPRCALIQLREKHDPILRNKLRRMAGLGLPPPLMRFRIGEDTNPFRFLTIGEHLFKDLQRCLDLVDAKLSDLPRVLDFGCGCGRTLLPFMNRFPGHSFTGTDVDPEAIAWCSDNLKPAHFQVNRPVPPLPIEGASLDLIYGISVFTHLDRQRQEAWIPELSRVLRPGGALIISVNGTSAASQAGIEARELRDLERDGVVFLRCKKLTSIHPEWYQTSFNDSRYTEAAFGAHFSEVRYLSRVFGFQDAVVCRR